MFIQGVYLNFFVIIVCLNLLNMRWDFIKKGAFRQFFYFFCPVIRNVYSSSKFEWNLSNLSQSKRKKYCLNSNGTFFYSFNTGRMQLSTTTICYVYAFEILSDQKLSSINGFPLCSLLTLVGIFESKFKTMPILCPS